MSGKSIYIVPDNPLICTKYLELFLSLWGATLGFSEGKIWVIRSCSYNSSALSNTLPKILYKFNKTLSKTEIIN